MNQNGRLESRGKALVAWFVAGVLGACTSADKKNAEANPSAGGSGSWGGAAGFTGVDIDIEEDASALDADELADVGPHCAIGAITSVATADNVNLFGTPIFFNDGNPLPPGSYLIRYIDGCMKFYYGLDWTVNDSATGCCNWWLIGDDPSDKKFVLPGMTGYLPEGRKFETFEDCVRASKRSPSRTFDFEGGKLGIWLQDTPYEDNLVGQDGRNPKWQLVRLSSCDDPVAFDAGQSDSGESEAGESEAGESEAGGSEAGGSD
jgi:hypothetical protein